MRITIGLNVVAFVFVAGFFAGCSSGSIGPSDGVTAPKSLVAQSTRIRVAHSLSVALPPGVRSRFAPTLIAQNRQFVPAVSTPAPACRTYGADASVKCEIVTCSPPDDTCDVYSTTGTLLGLRTGFDGEEGVAADRQGNSYIANTLAADVLEFNRGLSILESTLHDPAQYPVDVSVFPGRHIVAVSNIESLSGGPGSVSVYTGGSTYPTRVLTDPSVGFAEGIGVAFDRAGDCVWSLNDFDLGQGQIDEFRLCAGPPVKVVSGLGFAGGVAFDALGNLYYTDQYSAALFKCVGTRSCTQLTGGFSDPIMINFDDRLKFLWLADNGAGVVDAIDSTTGSVAATFPAGDQSAPPIGVAHVPGPPF